MTAATLTVANALKTLVSATFPSVGFVTAASPETAVQTRALPAGLRPPCVLILAGDGVYEGERLEKEQKAQVKELEDKKEAEELIRKALERSEEHEAEKKARMLKAPLSPNERDW